MDAINITNARQNFFNIAEQAVTSSKPVRITSKTGDVVLISASDWDAIEETMYLHSVPGIAESIIEGMNAPEEGLIKEEDFKWDV